MTNYCQHMGIAGCENAATHIASLGTLASDDGIMYACDEHRMSGDREIRPGYSYVWASQIRPGDIFKGFRVTAVEPRPLGGTYLWVWAPDHNGVHTARRYGVVYGLSEVER